MLVVGSAEFSAISTQAGLFENAVAAVGPSISGAATTLSSVVTAQLTAWKTKEQGILRQIDDKKRELEARGIRVDMAYIQKLATDEARIKQRVATLNTWKPSRCRPLEAAAGSIEGTLAAALADRHETRCFRS